MKKSLLSIIVIGAQMLCSCIRVNVGGQEQVGTYSYSDAINAADSAASVGFSRVKISGGMDVYHSISDSVTIRFEGDTANIARMMTTAENGTLSIRRVNTGISDVNYSRVKVYLTSPSLTSIDVAGSGDVHADSLLIDGDAAISVSGSGGVNVAAVKSEVLNASIAGSGDIKVDRAEVKSGGVSVAGSGKFKANGYKADNFEVEISGSGSVKVDSADIDFADLSIAGSGSVKLNGRVNHYKENVAGSGTVEVKN